MIQINSQRECEITQGKLNDEIIKLEKQQEQNEEDQDNFNSIIAQINLAQQINPQNLSSPILSCQNNFDKAFYSSHYPDQFCESNLKMNSSDNKIQQITEKQSSNSINTCVKSPHILSPTPLKTINFVQNFLINSTSHSLASSSFSSNSSGSSQSSLSCIPISQLSKDSLATPNAWHHINNSCSTKKMSFPSKNLYNSEDEQDQQCKEREQDIVSEGNMQRKRTCLKEDMLNKENKEEVCNYPCKQLYYTEEDTEEDITGKKKSECIINNQFKQESTNITHFTLDDNTITHLNSNNKTSTSSSINNQTSLLNTTNKKFVNSQYHHHHHNSTTSISFFNTPNHFPTNSINIPRISNPTNQSNLPFSSSNEMDCDNSIIGLSIDRMSAQNPQSKDEEFLNLNVSSFSDATFEQFKESLLQDLLDESF